MVKRENPAKARRSGKRLTKDDDDEEIPELMLPLIDDEVDFAQSFIEKEVKRRLQEIKDQKDDQGEDDEMRRAHAEQKEKMLELEKRMKIIQEKDERLRKYIAEKRLKSEKTKKDEQRKRQNSDFLINQGKVQEDSAEKIKKLELLLKEEKKRRALGKAME